MSILQKDTVLVIPDRFNTLHDWLVVDRIENPYAKNNYTYKVMLKKDHRQIGLAYENKITYDNGLLEYRYDGVLSAGFHSKIKSRRNGRWVTIII